jgi:Phage integrase family
MSGWHSAWRSLTRAIHCHEWGQLQQPAKVCANDQCTADLSKVESPLHGLRFHDLRHHAVTELAESQASERTIMAIAGHISPRMLEHYSHIRMDAKRKALEALSARSLTVGYDTKDGTKSATNAVPSSYVIEKNGGDDGTRTRGLCRDRAAF